MLESFLVKSDAGLYARIFPWRVQSEQPCVTEGALSEVLKPNLGPVSTTHLHYVYFQGDRNIYAALLL